LKIKVDFLAIARKSKAFPCGEGGPLAVDEVSHKRYKQNIAAKQILLHCFIFIF